MGEKPPWQRRFSKPNFQKLLADNEYILENHKSHSLLMVLNEQQLWKIVYGWKNYIEKKSVIKTVNYELKKNI